MLVRRSYVTATDSKLVIDSYLLIYSCDSIIRDHGLFHPQSQHGRLLCGEHKHGHVIFIGGLAVEL